METKKEQELLTRGVEEIIGIDTLKNKLKNKQTLRIKLGIDPTSPNLHLGRSIPLLKLRDFQILGHTIVFIVGDFTGVIGDTSDKESERPMLSEEIIEENKKSYFEQVGKIVDLKKAEFHYNSSWLGKLTYREIGEHADQFSVAEFIARENIKKRLDTGKRVSLREMLYPLMQGYDSVAVKADVEIGGTDQRFNILAGRTLQSHFNQEPQSIITNPLIPGLDGRKMSSSWGNTINLNDEPNDMYGKVMSLNDDLLETYYRLCTRYPLEKIEAIFNKKKIEAKEIKMQLAREIVALYHNESEAKDAEKYFIQTFQNKQIPKDIQITTTKKGTSIRDVLLKEAVVSSKTEWRRLIEAGAIRDISNDTEEKVTDSEAVVVKQTVLRIGKRRFIQIDI
jgi:tyrosyl-tRNA synthetase